MKVLLRECGDNISDKGFYCGQKDGLATTLIRDELLQYVTGMPPLH
jgi:hypothetical protein